MTKFHRGFTLLEVMVAGIILFAAISTVSMIYRNTINSQQLSIKHLKIASVVPFLLDEVRDEIRNKTTLQSSLAGEGSNFGVEFFWQAEQIMSKKPLANELAADEVLPQNYILWQVKLKVQYETYTKEYQFREFSWWRE